MSTPISDPLQAILALLFANPAPLELQSLVSLLGISAVTINELINNQPLTGQHAFIIQRHDNLVQLATNPIYSQLIRDMLNLESAKELTPAAKETLAIIAYKQPIDRSSLESIRGLDCRRTLQSLSHKGLIQQSSGMPEGGDPRSYYYEVSLKFLEYFGLKDKDELKTKLMKPTATL